MITVDKIFEINANDFFQFIMSGLLLPTAGYAIGWMVSKVFKLEKEKKLAIAISTVNTHAVIAIKLLYVLSRSQNNLAALVPLAAIILSPLPLLMQYVFAATL